MWPSESSRTLSNFKSRYTIPVMVESEKQCLSTVDTFETWMCIKITDVSQQQYVRMCITRYEIHICDVGCQKVRLCMIAILSLTFVPLLEHFVSFKMTPYSLKLIKEIRCYKWNAAGKTNYVLFSWFFPLFSKISLNKLCHKVPSFNMTKYKTNFTKKQTILRVFDQSIAIYTLM